MRESPPVERDERTSAVENASYSISYKILTYALLLDVMYRSLLLGDASWDLLGLVIVSGMVATVYQARQNTLSRSWGRLALLTFVISFVIAIVVTVALAVR